jgi:hypothetical protein
MTYSLYWRFLILAFILPIESAVGGDVDECKSGLGETWQVGAFTLESNGIVKVVARVTTPVEVMFNGDREMAEAIDDALLEGDLKARLMLGRYGKDPEDFDGKLKAELSGVETTVSCLLDGLLLQELTVGWKDRRWVPVAETYSKDKQPSERELLRECSRGEKSLDEISECKRAIKAAKAQSQEKGARQ